MATETDATARNVPDREPPGPDGLPVLGNTLELLRDVFEFYERLVAEYGDVVRYRVLGDEAYLLTHPDFIEQVLVDDSSKFVKGEMTNRQIGSALGEGMLLAEGDDWRAQRTTAQPAFYRERIAEYGDIMVDYTTEAMTEWDDGTAIEINREMTRLTLRILARTLFGIDIRGQQSVVRETADAMRTRFDSSRLGAYLPEWLPTPANRQYKRSLADLREFIDELIAERRTADGTGDDLLSLLVAAADAGGMNDATLRDNMVTFLFAGHETTALALTYTWFLLGHNPEAQQRLYTELDDVLDGEPPTAADLSELNYTEQVVNEAMRLYPPVWTFFREPTEDIEIGGYTIPEGSVVSLPQWVVHRDERWYDDPLEFRPERWAEERGYPDSSVRESPQWTARSTPTTRSAAVRATVSGCASPEWKLNSSSPRSHSATPSKASPIRHSTSQRARTPFRRSRSRYGFPRDSVVSAVGNAFADSCPEPGHGVRC
jgi:cytochrome P450